MRSCAGISGTRRSTGMAKIANQIAETTIARRMSRAPPSAPKGTLRSPLPVSLPKLWMNSTSRMMSSTMPPT